jgi:hypothetical protein
LADELRAGIDVGSWPVQRKISGPRGVHIRVVCSAIRRMDALQVADVMRDIAAHWDQRIQALQPLDVGVA